MHTIFYFFANHKIVNYLRSRSGYAKLKSCLCKKVRKTLSSDFLSKISKHLSTFDFFTSVWHDTTFHHILLLGQLTIIKGHCQTVTNIYHRIKCVFGKILGTAILFCNGCIRFFKDFMSVVLPSYHPSNDSISDSFCKKWFTSRIQVKNSWPIFINDFYMPLDLPGKRTSKWLRGKLDYEGSKGS